MIQRFIPDLESLRGAQVLVTGGLGFIGQNLVRRLISLDCRVTVLDNCENSHTDALADVMDQIRFVHDSVTNEVFINSVARYHYIFHLACVQIAHSAKDPLLDLRVNAQSTMQMLERLRGTNRLKRFLYTSSASVYGSAKNFACVEDGPTEVLSHYASTKLLGDQYTRLYHSLYGMPTSVVRYSNVYGPGQTPTNPYCGVIGKFITSALADDTLVVYGDGIQTRDYTFVDDAVNATLYAAVAPQSVGRVYNVGTGCETSVLDLIHGISSTLGSVEFRHIPERAIDNIRRRCMDISRILEELNWTPHTSLHDGLRKTIEWCRAQTNHVVVT